ncbi:MAG TPA: hypothetical protein VGF92_23280 [Stellaceae bacterium]|jgi:predicted RNA-binding Zn-ribbon protein involved in translation (DUF1610 family)
MTDSGVEQQRYARAWRAMRNRGYLFLLVLLGGAAVVLGPVMVVDPALIGHHIPLLLTGMTVWLLLATATGFYAARFKCPRCGDYFNGSSHRLRWFATERCSHCGLPAKSFPAET